MRQSRRRTTPVVYTQPKTTAISEATRIALLRDHLDILNEQYNFNFNTMPPPASGPTLLGPTGLPLSPSTAAATGIPPAAANANPGLLRTAMNKVGAEMAEDVIRFLGRRLVPAGLGALAAGTHYLVGRERWKSGDKAGAVVAALGGVGSIMAAIPWAPVSVTGFITVFIAAGIDQFILTPEGKEAVRAVDEKMKEPAGPSGATPAPKPAEPKPAGPSGATPAPKVAEPKPAEPKPAEPTPAEPKAAEPKAAEPKPEKGPNPAGGIGKIDWSKLKPNP
jgi:hypothetical protein